ncbi:MAG TPA: class I SAM-dependent methyltransferase [Polyangia bacterium]|jgi:SAM-dependent methyltransferase
MYQLHQYLEMMVDRNRLEPLEAAIRSRVRPGDVVLDLGAGTGVLSFIALHAGAAHVYAVELSPYLEVARQVARANGLAERITFIQADARTMVLPRQVDGLIGDVRGTLPLLRDNIDLFQFVRERWLKPGGYTVPLADEIHVSPVAAAAPHRRVSGWLQPRPEAHYEAAAAVAANLFVRENLAAADVLAGSQALGSIRYDGATPRKLSLQTSFVIERSATMTGLGLWFRGRLTPEIVFDTSPFSPATVYGQAFLPLSQARPVAAGETITVSVAAYRAPSDAIWKWTIDSPSQSLQSSPWRERHSTFEGTTLGRAGIDWLTGTKRPTLSEEGRLARHLSAALDGKTTANELAVQVKEAFPGRFASLDDALSAVMTFLGRYAAP